MQKFKVNATAKKNLITTLIFICSVVAMWLVWEIAYISVGNDILVPSFSNTLKKLIAVLSSPSFYRAFGGTLLRTFSAFLISVGLAVVASSLGILFEGVKIFLKPIVSVVRTLPTVALILILIIALPTRKSVPVVIAVLVLFPMIYAQINAAWDRRDRALFDMAKVYKLPKKTVVTKIAIPQVLPYVLSQTGANLSFAIKLTVSAELLANLSKSLGGLMQSANVALDASQLIALTLTSVIVGLIVELVFDAVYKFVTRRYAE